MTDQRTRPFPFLEKAATDNGFDQLLPPVEGWLAYGSARFSLRIWLSAPRDGLYLVALSQAQVAEALDPHGTPMASPLPEGAAAGRTVPDLTALHRLLRRAFQVARTLPDELLRTFEEETAELPRRTEAQRRLVQGIGQDLLHVALLDYWDGRCAITGLATTELLRANHIKPWTVCDTDAERLDVFNGLVLAPHLDAAFDHGLITIADDRTIVVSPLIAPADREILGLHEPVRILRLDDRHRHYLRWHHEYVFDPGDAADA